VNKNYFNYHRVGYKSPFNLVKFIEMHGDLEDELKDFEGALEWDEVVEL
jgi:hypothetical protein